MPPSADSEQYTPMMKQYLAIKKQYPDKLVFYRMGDFYELFFEDAEKVSQYLDLTLTARGKSKGEPIKMAGIPYHAVETYISRLTRMGKSVVMCDQVGKPTKGKGIMERQVTRILTPGTLTDELLLDDKTENRLAAISISKKTVGIAWMTLTAHRIHVLEISTENILQELNRIRPCETLVNQKSTLSIPDEFGPTPVPEWYFDEKDGRKTVIEHFNVHDLSGFDCEDLPAGISAASALLQYIKMTQCRSVDFISEIKREHTDDLLRLNAATRRNLEISETLRGQPSPTLFSLLDHCKTGMGARFLKHTLHNPTRNSTIITQRLDAIDWLLGTTYDGVRARYTQFRDHLAAISDIERISARIGLRSAKPTDLSALRYTLEILPHLSELLHSTGTPLLETFYETLATPLSAPTLLARAIIEAPPSHIRDGGVIRTGYSAELDRLRSMTQGHDEYISKLEEQERMRTGIPTLKIDSNQNHGFFIDITNAHLSKIPSDYKRRQILKGRERFTTPELEIFERSISTAAEEALQLEKQLYDDLQTQLAQEIHLLQSIAQSIAHLDMLCGWADIALYQGYVRPVFSRQQEIHIKGGRHPIVEKQVSEFMANDTYLNADRQLLLLTGPNMGGKSTYMRQIALIVLMAYCGCYVPAQEAIIGPIDQIFTRVGASDDMVAGKSTFMVEMTEAASILNYATAHSLVLIDELGRGTSTFDGLSLAWAIAQYLVNHNRALTLFATHYFELTSLPQKNPKIINLHVSALEHDETITFLHKVEEGPASRSYGLQVSALAGVPPAVLQIARRKLNELEKQAHVTASQSDIFAQTPVEPMSSPPLQAPAETPQGMKAIALINQLQPDEMSPKEALEALYELKRNITIS